MRDISHILAVQHARLAASASPASVAYSYEIFLTTGRVLALTSCSSELIIDGRQFAPYSSLQLIKAEFNDSADNLVILAGIFEVNGITRIMDLTGCKIKVYSCLDGVLSLLVSYYISEFEKNDLDFVLKCEPETAKYNQSLLLLFSRTCRANFGDPKCGVTLGAYRRSYRIRSIRDKVVFVDGMNMNNGYYNLGQALFEGHEDRNSAVFKIIAHYNDRIELATIVPEDLLTQTSIALMPNCDKNFGTCCNKFNNAINFRGEPTIPEHNFLKSDTE